MIHEQLIPACYIERVAARQTRAEECRRLISPSEHFLALLLQSDQAFRQIDQSMQATIA